MFRKCFVSIVIPALFLMSVPVSVVVAGVEPSPFQPEINQLGAVANMLNSADFRVVKTMSVPPDPCVPPESCKGLNGSVNRLEAIDRQVSSAADMITSMITEAMGVEPSPFREDLVPPLVVVRSVAAGIAGKVDEFIRVSTGSVAFDFIIALGMVSDSAVLLTEIVDDGIEQLRSDVLECTDIHDEASCNATELCTWTYAGACVVAH